MYFVHGHELTNLKGIMSAYDNSLFLWHDATGNLMGILAIYVEDFIFCGNLITELKKMFKVGMQESGTSKFLGLDVRQTKDGITIDQNLNFIYIPKRHKEKKIFEKK